VGSAVVKDFAGRLVAATHASLEQRVATHLFREDLFYRLNVLTVRVPGLDERIDDIPLLAEHFCRQQARPLHLASGAIDLLCAVPWRGNVRQLRNLIDRVAVFCEAEVISPELLRRFLERDEPIGRANDNAEPPLESLIQAVLRLSVDNKLEAVTDALIAQAMAACGGNKSAVARLLGVHRKAIERRTEKAAKVDNVESHMPAGALRT
jgi:DNA-binding NtrC family response regulator